MARLPNWVDNYTKFIVSRRSMPFEFGSHDCCITVCDMIRAITGTDPAVDFRHLYNSPLSALRKIKEYGDVDNIAEEVCKKFGWQEIAPNYATRCDIACVDTGGGRKALGWFDLDASKIFLAGMVGVQDRPRREALRAWRIN